MKTVVDEDFRKTWELDPAMFKYTNPKWTNWISKILTSLHASLGMADGITGFATLHKLLLYTEGAKFKKHKEFALRSSSLTRSNADYAVARRKNQECSGLWSLCYPRHTKEVM